jgi:hypothetical protein
MTSVALKSFAHTDEDLIYPAFINIARWPDGSVKLIVRSSPKDGNCGTTSEISISAEKWQEAVDTVAT